MKTLYLICSHIRQYIIKNRAVFALFLVGGIVNAIVFCYLYGNLLPSVRNKDSVEIYYRQYRVVIRDYYDESVIFPEEEYSAFLEGIRTVSSSDLFESVVRATSLKNKEICAMEKGEPPVVKVKGSIRTPVGDEVIVPIDNRHAVGEKIMLFDRELTVIGQHTTQEYYVSRETLDSIGQSIKVFAISYTHYDPQNDLPEKMLQETFPGGFVKTPSIYVMIDNSESTTNMISMCVCYLIASIAFMSLFKYLLESMSAERIISSMVGATQSHLAVMTFWEGTILTCAASLAGIALHRILTPVLFDKINMTENMTYTIGDYSYIFLVLMVLSLLVTFFFTLKYSKKTFLEALRHRV